jgi:hypothetical protein
MPRALKKETLNQWLDRMIEMFETTKPTPEGYVKISGNMKSRIVFGLKDTKNHIIMLEAEVKAARKGRK